MALAGLHVFNVRSLMQHLAAGRSKHRRRTMNARRTTDTCRLHGTLLARASRRYTCPRHIYTPVRTPVDVIIDTPVRTHALSALS